MTQTLLKIEGLKVKVEDTEILHGIDLEIKAGEIHAIMGPNGSGKSTLSAALMGHPNYEITDGTVEFMGQDLLDMKPEDRAALGLFLSFQYPKEIPGVNLVSFMRASFNAVRKAQAEAKGEEYEAMTLFKFKKIMIEKMELIGMPIAFLERATNEGFSGGEKKKSEILQMSVLEPKLAILDETDSGLDIDALKDICKGIKEVRKDDQSILMITHYQRILDYITPDHIHIMMNGKVVMSGGADLAQTIEDQGYDYVRAHVGIKKESALKMVTS
jgi:Fe-S cluster assembly ATP-binding protein